MDAKLRKLTEKAKKAGKQDHRHELLSGYTKESLHAILQRFQPFIEALALLSKFMGMARLPEAWSVWRAFTKQIRNTLQTADYPVRTAHETQVEVTRRLKEVEGILKDRETQHMRIEVIAACAMDPRWLGDGGYQPAFMHDSLRKCKGSLLPCFFTDDDLQVAKHDFEQYALHTGEFASVAYPPRSAGLQEVFAWWTTGKPI